MPREIKTPASITTPISRKNLAGSETIGGVAP